MQTGTKISMTPARWELNKPNRSSVHRGGETTHDIRFIETEREILLSADGLICARFDTYGEAWKHAAWMHKAAGQEFTIEGQAAEEWFDEMDRRKLLDKRAYRVQEKTT